MLCEQAESRMYHITEWDDESSSQGPSMAEMEADVDMQVALLEERCSAFERQAESYASQVWFPSSC